MPTACAAMVTRLASMASRAMRKPLPSSPIRFSAGTRQLSNTSSAADVGMDAHLVLELADRESGRAFVYDERTDALVSEGLVMSWRTLSRSRPRPRS